MSTVSAMGRWAGKKARIPQYVCRLVYKPRTAGPLPQLFVDKDGYLISQDAVIEGGGIRPEHPYGCNWEARVLPLVHPVEWELIARTVAFGNPVYSFRGRPLIEGQEKGNQFHLLTIDARQVTQRCHFDHPGSLRYGEYFGEVPVNAVVHHEIFGWAVRWACSPNIPSSLTKGLGKIDANPLLIRTTNWRLIKKEDVFDARSQTSSTLLDLWRQRHLVDEQMLALGIAGGMGPENWSRPPRGI